MSISSFIQQCRHLRNTVISTYGKGVRSWFNYIYYALFRINKFKILMASLEIPLEDGIVPFGIDLLNPPINELECLRSKDKFPREFFCDQFQKVKNCMIALIDGELAYIHWVYYKGDFSRFLSIGSDSAEINYVITMPKHRGRGISTAAFMITLQNLKKQGLKKVYAVVHEENIASIKSFTRAGFVEVGTTVSLGPFNRKVSV